MTLKELSCSLTKREKFVVNFVDRFAVIGEDGYWKKDSLVNKIVFKVSSKILGASYFAWLRTIARILDFDDPIEANMLIAEIDSLEKAYN